MTYEQFAHVYDQLMSDFPYDKWLELIIEKKRKYGVSGNSFLDLACGTGELSVRLAQAGFRVTGVDLSENMLSIAQMKGESKGQKINFYLQNMVELDLSEKFHMIGIFCDSLNYLLQEEDVKKTFQKVFLHLENGGLFFFDVHSLYKMREIFLNQTFTYNGESVCYIWNCFQGEYEDSVDHELTFFVEDGNGKYDRFDEFHSQRTFSVETYERWLKETGFELLDVFGDFTNERPMEHTERILFVAKKKDSK